MQSGYSSWPNYRAKIQLKSSPRMQRGKKSQETWRIYPDGPTSLLVVIQKKKMKRTERKTNSKEFLEVKFRN